MSDHLIQMAFAAAFCAKRISRCFGASLLFLLFWVDVFASDSHTYKVGFYPSRPFVIFDNEKDNSNNGLITDLFALIEQNLDKPVEFIAYKSKAELLRALENKDIDIVPLIEPTPELEVHLNFTKPVVSIDDYFLVSERFKGAITATNVTGKTLAVPRRSAVAKYINKRFSDGSRIINIDSLAQTLIRLSEGQIDIVVIDVMQAAPLINQLKINNVRIAEKVDFKNYFAVGSTKDNPSLRRQLTQIINDHSASQLSSILLKWGVVSPDVTSAQQRMYWGTGGLLLGGVLIALLWSNIRLRSEVKKRDAFEQNLAELNIRSQMQCQQATMDARTDPLTGVNNRRRFEDILSNELSRFQRTGSAFCVMMIDIDYFKLINDEFGHATGDCVLVDIAKRINHTIRPYDILARLGGEEFGVLLPNTLLNEATQMGERLLEVVLDYRVDDLPELAVTISIGIKQAELNDAMSSIIEGADKALYESKNRGRNRVTDYQTATAYAL